MSLLTLAAAAAVASALSWLILGTPWVGLGLMVACGVVATLAFRADNGVWPWGKP